MSREIYLPYGVSGLTTLYASVRRPTDGALWSVAATAFEAFDPTHLANYAIPLAEESSSGNYSADFPAGITAAGNYPVTVRLRAGGSPAWPADAVEAEGDVAWSGSAVAAPTAPPPAGTPTPLAIRHAPSGLATVYFAVIQSGTKAWNGTAFEAIASADWAAYAIAATDAGGAGFYTAAFPAAIPAGTYSAYAFVRSGATAAPSDACIGVEADGSWDGTNFGPGGGGGISADQMTQLLDPLHGYPSARGGTTTTITLAATSGTDVVGQQVIILRGPGVDEVRTITAIDATTRVATVSPAWTVTPDATSVYGLAPAGADVSGLATVAQIQTLIDDNFPDGSVAGETTAQTVSVLRAVLAGTATISTTTTENDTVTFKNPDGSAEVRVVHDGLGNRTVSTRLL